MMKEQSRAVRRATRRLPPVLASYKAARGYDDVPESDLIDLIADALLFAEVQLGRAEAERILECAQGHYEFERPAARVDPLAELSPDLRARLVDEMGFEPELIGGGAHVLASYSSGGGRVWLSCFGGGGMPSANDWHVCAYPAGAEPEEAILSLTCGGGEFQPLSIIEATAAALSVLAEREGH